MNFQDAEKTYKDLKTQHDSGKLNDAAFEAEVGKLRMQDEQGRWWQIGVQTGEWYMHDGQKWNKAKPPAAVSAPTPTPVAPVVTPAIEPAPKPAAAAKPADDKKKQSAQKPDAKQPRASAMPRLFSPKPAGREGGLSRPVLFGIIAAVAIVILLLAVGGYFLYTTVFVAQAKPTATATVRALQTQVVPTRAATVAPTSTPLPPPTPVVTTTVALTTTITPTRAPVTAGPSPTKKAAASPTVAAPKGSPTPNVPPGVYAMKLETDPAKLSLEQGLMVTFKLTMFNNTGGTQSFRKWFVRIFTRDQVANGLKNSYGESPKADVNVGTGSVVITTVSQRYFGPGLCNFTAIPYYTDTNEQAVQFQKTTGGGLYYELDICQ